MRNKRPISLSSSPPHPTPLLLTNMTGERELHSRNVTHILSLPLQNCWIEPSTWKIYCLWVSDSFKHILPGWPSVIIPSLLKSQNLYSFNLLHKLDYVFNKIIGLLSLSEHTAAPSEDNRMLKRHPYKRNFYATFYGLT